MKKQLLAIGLALFGISASAATINWGSNGTVARFLIDGDGGTGSSNRLPTGSLVALVYLGENKSFSFDNKQDSYSFEANGVSGGTVVAFTTLTSGGKAADSYTKTPYTSMNGNYGMVYFDASKWEDIKAGTKYGITTDVSPVNLSSEVDQTQNAYLNSNVALTGTIVPEPSTAALALAGLALLLKRRKA